MAPIFNAVGFVRGTRETHLNVVSDFTNLRAGEDWIRLERADVRAIAAGSVCDCRIINCTRLPASINGIAVVRARVDGRAACQQGVCGNEPSIILQRPEQWVYSKD